MIPACLHSPAPLSLPGEHRTLSRLLQHPQPHGGARARECLSLANISVLLSSTVISGYFWPSLALPVRVLFQQEPNVPGCTRGWLQLEDPQSCPNPPSAPPGLSLSPVVTRW